jgi:hypothetical protein
MFDLNMRAPRANRLQEFVLPLSDSTQSTKYGSATKLSLGSKQFDPSKLGWRLRPETIATFAMLLGTTDNANAANGELYFVPISGTPSVIATVPTTLSLTAARVSVDVSQFFRPGASAGIFSARTWITTATGIVQATCYGAWLEVCP